MTSSLKSLTFFFVFMVGVVSEIQAVTTLCVEWGVSQGRLPDFDFALVLGQERVLYPPHKTILKLENKVVAFHGKGLKGQECITFVNPEALAHFLVGIHHFEDDATQLKYLELYEFKNDGTTETLKQLHHTFKDNMTGDESALPIEGSRYWVLIPVTEVIAGLATPAKEEKSQE